MSEAAIHTDGTEAICEASCTLSHLAALARWAGRGIVMRGLAEMKPTTLDEIGGALEWIGRQMEEQCAIIGDAL